MPLIYNPPPSSDAPGNPSSASPAYGLRPVPVAARAALCALLLFGCEAPAAPASPPGPSVVLLVLDGVRTDEFTSTEASDLYDATGEQMAEHTWEELAPRGVAIRNLLNTGVTVTAPAHASLFIGKSEAYANFPMRTGEGAGMYRPLLPTLFEGARSQLDLAEDQVLLAANTTLLEGVTHSLYPDAGAGAAWRLVDDVDDADGWPAYDRDVMDELRAVIDAHEPRLLVANLHDADRAGHDSEVGVYPEMVVAADAAVADLYAWIRDEHPEYAANLLFVVTGDHGRHRVTTENAWRNHGDACDGCREVPLFIVGGGAEAGVELEGAYTLLDLTPTLAAYLGISLPWAEGLPLFDAVERARTGTVNIASSGTLEASQRWLADRETRSEVVVNGVVLSTVGALGAEAPSVYEGETGRYACFRELVDQGDERPWVERCFADVDGAGLFDISFPMPEVAPFGAVALAEHAGRLWAAWAENPHGAIEFREGEIGLAIASWAGAWSTPTLLSAVFPTDAALVTTGESLVAAYVTSEGDPDYRYSRRVEVVPVTTEGETASLGASTTFTLTELLGAGRRVESPALVADGLDVRMAMLGIGTDAVIVAGASSADGGRSWGGAVALPDGGPILVHLPPQWDGDNVVWGVLVDEEASLCRASLSAAIADCREVGSARIQSFSVQGGLAIVVRDAGVAEWETTRLAW